MPAIRSRSRARVNSRAVSTAKRSKSSYSKFARSNTTIPFTLVRSMKGPFPPQYTATLRYQETVPIAHNSGAGSYIFTCNGLYDPNVTGTGHQPMGFAQLMTLYNHYKVTRSSIKITVLSAINLPINICCYVDDDTTPANYLAAYEQAGVVSVGGNTQAGNFRPLRQKWNGATIFGDTLIDKNHAGNATNNPTELSTYVIYSSDPTASSATYYVSVEIQYFTTFYELRPLPQS